VAADVVVVVETVEIVVVVGTVVAGSASCVSCT